MVILKIKALNENGAVAVREIAAASVPRYVVTMGVRIVRKELVSYAPYTLEIEYGKTRISHLISKEHYLISARDMMRNGGAQESDYFAQVTL